MIFPAASTNTLTVITNPADSDDFPVDNQIAVTVGNMNLIYILRGHHIERISLSFVLHTNNKLVYNQQGGIIVHKRKLLHGSLNHDCSDVRPQ